MSQILVVGSLAYDSIKTPSGSVSKTLGGSANYFSLAASLFSKVRVVGVVGEDYESKDFDLLHSRGVDLRGLEKVPGKTFHWEGAYHEDMNEAVTLRTELNVFEKFEPNLPAEYRKSEFIFLANISPDLQLNVLDQIENPKFVGMDTMNFWINSKISDLKAVLKRVNLLLVNEGEAQMLTNTNNAIAAAPAICEMGPQYAVIKRGEYGFVLYSKEHGFFMLPAMPIPQVTDPTGAGDTFAGGFFGYLAGHSDNITFHDLKMACVNGTMMSSFTIQDFGVRALAKVQKLDVENRLQEFKQVITL